MNTCDEVRMSLGALAVGALDPAEEQQVREHLERCPGCAEEAEALAETAGALGLIDADIEIPVSLPADLLPKVLARISADRRRRRMTGIAAAAAAVVLAGVGGLALGARDVWPFSTDDAGSDVAVAEEGPPDASVSGDEAGMAMQVDTWDKGWGTALRVAVSGIPAGSRCSLVAVGRDGSREIGASWVVPDDGYNDDGRLNVDGAIGLRSWDVDQYELVTASGATLVAASG